MPQGHNLISCPATGHQQVPLRDWVLDLWRSGRTISYRDGVLFHELAKEYKGIQGLTSKLDGFEHGASALVNTERNTPARKQPQHTPWIAQMTRRHGPFGGGAPSNTTLSVPPEVVTTTPTRKTIPAPADAPTSPRNSDEAQACGRLMIAQPLTCIGLDLAWWGGSKGNADSQFDCVTELQLGPGLTPKLRIYRVPLIQGDCGPQKTLDLLDALTLNRRAVCAIDAPLAASARPGLPARKSVPSSGEVQRRQCEHTLAAFSGNSDWSPRIQPGAPIPPRAEALVDALTALGLPLWTDSAEAERVLLEAFPAEALWHGWRAGLFASHSPESIKAYKKCENQLFTRDELAELVRKPLLPFGPSIGLDAEWPAVVQQAIDFLLADPLLQAGADRFKGGKLLDDVVDSMLCLCSAVAFAHGKAHAWTSPGLSDGFIVGPGLPCSKPAAPIQSFASAASHSSAVPHPSPEQQAVIDSQAPLLRVIARAGTGKTFTMVRKAVVTLQQDPAARVAMLTFTRNAADEMRQRFLLAGGDVTRFEADTFHGFALKRLLARGGDLILGQGLKLRLHGIRLLNEFDRSAICEYLAQDPELIGLGDDWYDKLSALLNKQDPGQDPPANLLDAASPSKELPSPALIWRKLLAFYAREGLLDFDGIMVFFEFLLRSDASFLQQCRDGLTHIFLDEFQDTNLPQLLSLQHLAGYTPGLTANPSLRQIAVVGDDFQTIYSFRGAVPGIFDRFAAWNSQACQTLGLRISRRSELAVLEVANATARRLATHRDHQSLCQLVPAELLPRPEAGPGQSCDLGRGQPEDFVAAIRQLKAQGLPLGQITCLAYANGTLSRLKEAFDQAGIPAFLLSTKPKERPGIRRFLAFLQLWIAPEAPAFSALWELCSRQRRDFDALWQEIALNPSRALDVASLTLPEAIRPAFLSTCRQLRPAPGLEEIFLSFTLQDPGIHAEAALARKILKLILSHPDFGENPQRLIGELTRRDFASPLGQRQDEVQLSTIHQFKGLEDTAILIAPDIRSNDDGEKLRLEYVARTRSKTIIASR
jgi:superfamily I DNA/RNA helicase